MTAAADTAASQLAVARHVVGGTEQEADAAVAEGDQVIEGLLSGHGVVARHAREPDADRPRR